MEKKSKTKKLVTLNKQLDKRRQAAERIEIFMNNLPSYELLASALNQYEESFALLLEFVKLRGRAQEVGATLKARFGGGGGNPALRAWQAKKIDESEYQTIMALVDWYDTVFALIQTSWEYIQQELKKIFIKDYPSDEIAYFFEILREDFDRYYQDCISGHKSSVRANERFAKTVRAACWQTPLGEAWADESALSALSEFSTKNHNAIWFGLALAVCNKYAESDSVVWAKLYDARRQIAKLADLLAIQCRRERNHNPPKIHKTHMWKDGQLYERTKEGWRICYRTLQKKD